MKNPQNGKPRVCTQNLVFSHEPFKFNGFGWWRYIYILMSEREKRDERERETDKKYDSKLLFFETGLFSECNSKPRSVAFFRLICLTNVSAWQGSWLPVVFLSLFVKRNGLMLHPSAQEIDLCRYLIPASFAAMVSAGRSHTVLLRNDGTVVACGWNEVGQCNIPPLDEGMSYTQVSAGSSHTVLLRNDGTVVACSETDFGQCNIPPLDEGMSYTQVSAGGLHTVLLRNDGTVVACGWNEVGQCNIPPLDEGMSYTQVSAGSSHTVLLRNDGTVVACGLNDFGQCNIPPLDEGTSYTQVSAGGLHTVLLRNDGTVVACGMDDHGRCDIPPLDEGMSYTRVSAGDFHTVLLRNDGTVVACGDNDYGQCNIPPLDEGMSYTRVSAGGLHTVLLRNDGTVVACGDNDYGQCNIPSLKSWFSFLGFGKRSLRYVPTCGLNWPRDKGVRVLQLVFTRDTGALVLTCHTLAGQEVLLLKPPGVELASALCKRIAGHLTENIESHQSLRLVLPDGQLLSEVCRANPAMTVEDLSQKQWDWQAKYAAWKLM